MQNKYLIRNRIRIHLCCVTLILLPLILQIFFLLMLADNGVFDLIYPFYDKSINHIKFG